MEETQTLYLSLHCRLCSVFQTNALPAPMIPWYGFLLGALTSQPYSPFKISFFFSLTAIQIPSPRAFAGSGFTLHSLWGSLASATSEDSQTCTLNQSLSSELRNQQHICLLDISAWTTHFAQSVCPLLTKLSVFFFLCSLDHQTTASSQHQALRFAFQPCF